MRQPLIHGLIAVTVVAYAAGPVRSDEETTSQKLGQFVTLTNPISESQVARVGNLAVELQAQAAREDKQAVMVIEVPAGTSTFGQVSDLAKRLTSPELSRVRLVAWVPRSIDGNHTILALLCHDIVMPDDAVLGDVGRGKAVPPEDQNFVLSLVDGRRNTRVSTGIAEAMMNPGAELLRVQTVAAGGARQTRFLTAKQVRDLGDTLQVDDTETIKQVGAPGRFIARDAADQGFLIAATVNSRADVAALYDLPAESMRESTLESELKPGLIRLHEPIHTVSASFVSRQIDRELAEGSNLLIFDIRSPGGEVYATMELADRISELDSSKVTTVAWINKQAYSGAAILAMATDRIIMHPEAHIGDAGMIQETAEGGQFQFAEEKVLSVLLTYLKTLAQRKNRPAALLEAMSDVDLEVYKVTHPETGRVTYMSDLEIADSEIPWEKGAMVPETRGNMFLTLTGKRAAELGLAEATCYDFAEVRERLGIPASMELVPAERTWVDATVELLNSMPGVIGTMTLMFFCIYLELHFPTGFFGICAASLACLFFWSHFMGGTAGGLELMMFLLGMVLLALEIFVIPGFGVFGVSGLLLIIASLVMASSTFAGMSSGEKFEQSMRSLGSLGASLCTVLIVAVAINKYMPSIPILNKLILTPAGTAAGGPLLNPSVTGSPAGGPVMAGDIGMAASTLRPAGKATFGEHFLDVVSDGGYIDHGTSVEVVRVAGNRIIVRPASEAPGLADNSVSNPPGDPGETLDS